MPSTIPYLVAAPTVFFLPFLVLALVLVFCPLQGKPFLCLNPLYEPKSIKAFDGELITKKESYQTKTEFFESDLSCDILKIVVNRYLDTKPSVSFVKGFGLKKGAIASSVAHDSHNIIAVGCSDEDILKAINSVIEHKGGIVCVENKNINILPLKIAGIISDEEGVIVAKKYKELNDIAKTKLGSSLKAPFMTLSFMALLVIPEIKLSDKGLFDVNTFKFISPFLSCN